MRAPFKIVNDLACLEARHARQCDEVSARLCGEAGRAITQLSLRVAVLEGSLYRLTDGFRDLADRKPGLHPGEPLLVNHAGLTVGDVWRARDLLKETVDDEKDA